LIIVPFLTEELQLQRAWLHAVGVACTSEVRSKSKLNIINGKIGKLESRLGTDCEQKRKAK